MAQRRANIQALPENQPLIFQEEMPVRHILIEDRMEGDAREAVEEVPGCNWRPEGFGQLALIYITF